MVRSINKKMFKSLAYVLLIISALYVIATSGWIITSNRSIITVMELLTVWAAIVIVQFMLELYRSSSENSKSQGLAALLYAVCMAVVTISNHFIYITVLTQLYQKDNMPDYLLLDGWPSISKGLECVSWGFFLGISMLYASAVFREWESKALVWIMRIFGILTLAGLMGPVLNNMNFYMLSTIGYSLGFLVISIELLVYFNKQK